jgi:hypothetical protein
MKLNLHVELMSDYYDESVQIVFDSLRKALFILTAPLSLSLGSLEIHQSLFNLTLRSLHDNVKVKKNFNQASSIHRILFVN